MKAHQVHILTWAMFGNFEEVDDPLEARRASERWSDVVQADREYGLDLDLTLFHPAPLANRDAWPLPNADTAGDLSLSYSVP